MKFRKPKRIQLPQTQPEFDSMAVDYLTAYGFEPSPDYLATFGRIIQMQKPDQDSFDPEQTAKQIRKAKADSLAYYLIRPQDRPKKEETSSEPSPEKPVA